MSDDEVDPGEAGNRDGNEVVSPGLHLNPNTEHAPSADKSVLVRRLRHCRQVVKTYYKPLYLELYNVHENFFVPSFLKAINENKEEGFRNLISQPSPGLLTFEMLQSSFCEMLIAEVENFEKWVLKTKFRMMPPNKMSKYVAALADIVLETMLDKLMKLYILPISEVFFPEVGGAALDSHHGFVVEYGMNKSVDLGLHVDDSEVTLNICLGKKFSGGELFFRGVRCDKQVNEQMPETESKSQEVFDCCHVPGRAILHCGRRQHGARATTSGHRINLLIWCRRGRKKRNEEPSDWCAVCQHEKKESKRAKELLKKEEELLHERLDAVFL